MLIPWSRNFLRTVEEWQLTHTCQALLGSGILKRFNMTFDYLHATLYLEKNKNYERPSVFNRAGLAPRSHAAGFESRKRIYRQSPRPNRESLRAI